MLKVAAEEGTRVLLLKSARLWLLPDDGPALSSHLFYSLEFLTRWKKKTVSGIPVSAGGKKAVRCRGASAASGEPAGGGHSAAARHRNNQSSRQHPP